MKVSQLLGYGSIDHKTAGLILYALQTGRVNLPNAEFEVEASDVVIDRDDVHRTTIGGPQWFEEDFEEEVVVVEEEGEADEEAGGENSVCAQRSER